ncbi:MAG: acyl-CoA dehydrogenase family protein [Deltaproteobacteria bacterium]
MYIGYTKEQEALRQELRDYYAELLTPEVVIGLHKGQGTGPVMRSIVKQMGADGWLGVGWPKEFGGRGMTPIEQFIFFDESMRSGAPVPMLTINSVAPSIMKFGTDEQKAFFLPPILRGEIHFCIGYTEPSAGTDLASLKTRAERDGDEYVINGQKVFTSLASDADYIWLAARSEPDAPKHKGLSMFAIDMKTPGISVDPMTLLASHDVNTTFFEDVRVPASAMVGKPGGGWSAIVNQLNHERVTLCSVGMLAGAYDACLKWAKETSLPAGGRVVDQEWVQINFAKVHAWLEFLKLINWKVAWASTHGALDVADASSIKVFGTEKYLDAIRLLMEIFGPRGYLTADSAAAAADGRLENLYRSLLILTFGGGTNEVQRDLIGLFGLGLPRIPRH